MEAAGAAAPVAANTTGSSEASSATPNGANGSQTPVKPTPPKPNGQVAKGGPGRDPNGRFAPNGTDKPDVAGEPPPPKEPYRFKKRIKVDGREEDVDLDEDGLLREVQIARAARSRMADLRKEQEARAKRAELAKSNPLMAFEDLAKEMGVDPDQLATLRLAERAKRNMMSPEEQRIAELEAETRGYKEQEAQRTKAEQERELRAFEDQQWQKDEPEYMKAFEEFKLPKDPWVMGLMGSAGIDLQDALGKQFPVNPRDVVAETHRRLETMSNRYVMSLPTEALMDRLGEQRVESIVRAHLMRFKKSQSFEPPVVTDAVPVVESEPGPAPKKEEEWIDPNEFWARQRELRNKRK